MLIKHLPHNSALVRALNDGRPGFSPEAHLLADLWALWVNSDPKKPPKDHPVRAAMEAKARAAALMARLSELKADYEKRKQLRSNKVREEAV